MSRLDGHTLQSEGAAFNDLGERKWTDTGGMGRGKCFCGEMSRLLGSGNQRKKWHRAHKDEIRSEAR